MSYFEQQTKQLKEDHEFRSTVIKSKDKTELPPGYEKRFIDLIDEIEALTGDFYEVSVRQSGTYHEIKLKSLDQRGGYVVSNMKEGYEGLNGTYASIEDINKRMMDLKYDGGLQPDGKKWKCPKCGVIEKEETSPSGQKYTRENFAHKGWGDVCQFCHYSPHSKWEGVSVSLDTQSVYTSSGGSLSICHPIGKVVIKR